MTARYLAKPLSFAHSRAALLPHLWANMLILQASEMPISLVVRATLLSGSFSNFLVIDKMFLAKKTLRTVPATFIVKSISTLSILCRALNQAPERMALCFSLSSCALSRKLKQLSRGTFLGKVVNSPFFFRVCHFAGSNKGEAASHSISNTLDNIKFVHLKTISLVLVLR